MNDDVLIYTAPPIPTPPPTIRAPVKVDVAEVVLEIFNALDIVPPLNMFCVTASTQALL